MRIPLRFNLHPHQYTAPRHHEHCTGDEDAHPSSPTAIAWKVPPPPTPGNPPPGKMPGGVLQRVHSPHTVQTGHRSAGVRTAHHGRARHQTEFRLETSARIQARGSHMAMQKASPSSWRPPISRCRQRPWHAPPAAVHFSQVTSLEHCVIPVFDQPPHPKRSLTVHRQTCVRHAGCTQSRLVPGRNKKVEGHIRPHRGTKQEIDDVLHVAGCRRKAEDRTLGKIAAPVKVDQPRPLRHAFVT